jgi:hypothetical protein
MFLGHFGLAFGAKNAAPAVSLGTLFAACQFADLLWPNLVLLDVEHLNVQPGATVMTPLDFASYPYSHSLVALLMWSALFALVYKAVMQSRTAAAVTLGVLVLSHWLLDVIAHRPDMPIGLSGTTRLGLGLWNSTAGTLAVEFLLLAAGLLLYTRSTVARDRVGSAGLWALVAFLAVVYLASTFGPPPPDANAVAWSAQAMWLLVGWGYWIDRHRAPLRVVARGVVR